MKRRDGESDFDYKERLVVSKINREIDIDWSEMVGILNLDCSGDHLRKTSYGIYEAYQNRQNKQLYNISDNNILEEMDLKKIELEKERRKFFDQRREYKKLITFDARFDYLTEKLIESVNRLNQEKPLNFGEYNYNSSDNEALLCFNDWHYGMVADNIWNTYNTDVCKQRVELLVAKTKKHIELHKPRVLHMALLGDAPHGAIHTSCRVEAEEDACDQLMHVAEIMAEAISEIGKCECLEEIYIHSTYGNHVRTIQNKKDSKHSDNMEKIIPWWLKQRFKNAPKVKIIDSEYYEFIKINILGYNIVAAHGDLDKIKDFGVMVNTIFTKKYHENIDYAILADKHHTEEFDEFGIESILVKSLCGTDGYANDHRLYSDAGQTLMFFTEEDGRQCTYNIKLS